MAASTAPAMESISRRRSWLYDEAIGDITSSADSFFRSWFTNDEMTLSNLHLGVCIPVRAWLVYHYVWQRRVSLSLVALLSFLTFLRYVAMPRESLKPQDGGGGSGGVWWNRQVDMYISMIVALIAAAGMRRTREYGWGMGGFEWIDAQTAYELLTLVLAADTAYGAYKGYTRRMGLIAAASKQ